MKNVLNNTKVEVTVAQPLDVAQGARVKIVAMLQQQNSEKGEKLAGAT